MRRWRSTSEAETREIGRRLAEELAPDRALLLTGDLGAGKTVLVRGLAEGLGVDPAEIQSPTFTLVREHDGRSVRLLHFDLYRLEPHEVEAAGLVEALFGPGVKAVEWAERLGFKIPGALRLEVRAREGRREVVELEQATQDSEESMAIRKVGVLGCGLMGAGIAEVAAKAGFETVVREVGQELLDRGMKRLRGSLDRAVEKGKLDGAARDATLARLTGTTELEPFADCDLVIEAIVENLDEKKRIFGALDALVQKSALFATNTSSLTVTQLAMATERPDRVIGLHFFNPVPVMKLVEVVRTLMTDEGVLAEVTAWCRAVGKTPVACKDNSGFIVNRLLVPYLLDAIRALEEGVGTVEDIDEAMKLGCGYPMGPFTLLDFVGLDTTYYIAEIMFEEYREKRFAPPPLLKQMVQARRFGRKSGRGFYDYAGK